MDSQFKGRFERLWKKYFNNAELPIVFYYTDEVGPGEVSQPRAGVICIIGVLAKVRRGVTVYFDSAGVNCLGGKRYLGFAETIMPGFEYFLSCGIPGQFKGERYKKTPELANAMMERIPPYKAPHRYIAFKRWDMLEEKDKPDVVIFFAEPDVLSALYSLANFDESDPNSVITPHCAGCAHIVHFPYLERNSEHPRAVVGMFDIHARPFVQKSVLTFAAPINKFVRMVDNMEESFLSVDQWAKVQKRLS